MRYFLLGFMGCGKSTLGKVLSREMGIPFYDLDRYIEQMEGLSIPDIFARHGESGFRGIEQRRLYELCLTNDSAVVSLGGGTPIWQGNMEWLNQNGTTIYIKMESTMLYHRLLESKTQRPLIQGLIPSELEVYIAEELKKRDPIYNKAKVQVLNPSRDGKLLLKSLALFDFEENNI